MQNLSASDQQNLIYLVILLAFLGSSLLFNRNLKISQVLKYLGLWAAIAFVGVALYAYRYQFADFKSRMLQAINPTAAQTNDRGELIINLSSDGHFYMDVKVNGVPMRFMIDTGASDIAIDKEQAQKIGINMQDLVFNKMYQTANGSIFGASIVLREVQVGDVVLTNISASVNGAKLGMPLLGMSFLRQFRKYEFYQDRLVLTL